MSVIVPTYKRLTYLGGALRSALGQSYPAIEVIVSDDAASGEAAGLVAAFGDPRLRYRHNGPAGVGATRNALAAYRSARGEYIATLHDDDQWEPRFLERLVPPLVADSRLSVAFSDHWVMGSDGVVDPRATEINTRRWRRHRLREGAYRPFHSLALVDRAVPMVMAAVFRKAAIEWSDFPREMEPAYDLWLGYLACRDGAGAYYSPERLTRYRVHPEAESVQRRHEAALIFCYERFLADERLSPVHRGLRQVRASFDTGLGVVLLSQGRRQEARRWLRRGLANAPSARGMIAMGLSFSPGSPARSLERLRAARRWLRRLRDASRVTPAR